MSCETLTADIIYYAVSEDVIIEFNDIISDILNFKSDRCFASLELSNYYDNSRLSPCISTKSIFVHRPIMTKFRNFKECAIKVTSSSNIMRRKTMNLKLSKHISSHLVNKEKDISRKKGFLRRFTLIKKLNCFHKLHSKSKYLNVSLNKFSNHLNNQNIPFKYENHNFESIHHYHNRKHGNLCTDFVKNSNDNMEIPIVRENDKILFGGTRNSSKFLLGPPNPEDKSKKCCVIDLDETLVHSSFKELSDYDFKVSVEIEGNYFDVFIMKRPYVDEFLDRMGQLFECVLFTASLAKYANLVTNVLDRNKIFRWRLFREACVYYRGSFVKDLSMLGRPIEQIVILDNSSMSFLFNMKNAVHVISWFNDPEDRALLDLIPFCERLAQSSSAVKFLQLEPPPQSAAFPLTQSLVINNHILSASKHSSTDSSPSRSDMNPISSISAEVESLFAHQMHLKKNSKGSKRNYSDKGKTPSITSIRSFLTKGGPVPTTSTSDTSKLKPEMYDSLKPSVSRSSVSTTLHPIKDSSTRTSTRSSLTQGVAFNSTAKSGINTPTEALFHQLSNSARLRSRKKFFNNYLIN